MRQQQQQQHDSVLANTIEFTICLELFSGPAKSEMIEILNDLETPSHRFSPRQIDMRTNSTKFRSYGLIAKLTFK